MWEDNTYINTYLNLRFVMPHGWSAAEDADIAELVGLGADVMAIAGNDLGEAFWDAMDVFVLIDMMAADPFTGINVQVLYERLRFPFTRITAEEYAQHSAAEIGAMGEAYIFDEPVRIGDYYWHSFSLALDAFGGAIVNRNFVNVQDGFARMIIITYNTMLPNPVDDLLARFSSLNDPPPPPEAFPEPPAPEPLDEALFGVWLWDMDEDYILFFYEEGWGVRGFYPDVDEFEWRTYPSDNHLIINIGFMNESWTYTIEGDVLTIESRQVVDFIFSYIRE